ncbi:MAG: DNA mismatch endonuclease Vsr [candidate division Zixibacteria bacterium]|nr:DNA mismatch endonuclease Vsr [candidate division Zixibacteria bacterium]
MPDVFTKKRRSEIMARIGGSDTRPEKVVRSILFKMGYRYRLNVKKLPGKPDIVLPKYKIIVFIHGCFWHGHKRCKRGSMPRSNTLFWKRKIEGNRGRDVLVRRRLKGLGWRVLVIWECQLRNPERIANRLCQFIESGGY